MTKRSGCKTANGLHAVTAGLLMLLFACQLLSPPVQAQESSLDYRIDAGDILNFDILDDEDLPVQLTISGSGQIQLPLVGGVTVAGMTIPEALEELRKQYIKLQLFIEPKIAVSVATYRPIFVLGEVKQPGSFPFQSYLTTEQAIGLAGGMLTGLNDAEDRILTRARLQGELYVNSADLAKEALFVARYAAQIAGRTSITNDDIPAEVRPFLDQGVIDKIRRGEERTLQADTAAFAADMVLIDDNIMEAKRQIDLLEELVANQKKSIRLTGEGLQRTNDLLKKGLKTASDLAEFQRQLTSDEGRLLTTLSEISQAKRAVSTLNRERAQLRNTRKKEALQLHQEHSIMTDKLVVLRRGIEEQLLLVASMNAEDAQQIKTAVISYKVRRRGRTGLKDISADSQTELHPGDVLIVAIERVGQPS